jgi:hypothetical protein
MEFSPKLSIFNNVPNKNKFPWEQFICVIDESGSTNNLYGRCRGSRFDNESNLTSELSTKVIYIAEEEALAHIFVNLANTYDMTDIILILSSFSSKCVPEINIVLKSDKELYDIANNINLILNKEFGGTNLTLALETTITDFTKNTLFILASDGRPDNCITTLSVLDTIINKINDNNKRIDIFCIGAGSIQQSTNGSINYISRRGRNNLNLSNDDLLSNIRNLHSAECNQEFLQALTEKANTGGYAGAFGDYTQLQNGFINFLNNLKIWKVVLDNSLIDLIPLEQDIMNNLEIDKNKLALVFRPNFGYYVLCSNGLLSYQLAVTKVNNYNSIIDYPINEKYEQCFIEDENELDFYNFNKLYIRNLPESYKQIVFVTSNKNYYRPEIIYDSQFRIRKLCQLN